MVLAQHSECLLIIAGQEHFQNTYRSPCCCAELLSVNHQSQPLPCFAAQLQRHPMSDEPHRASMARAVANRCGGVTLAEYQWCHCDIHQSKTTSLRCRLSAAAQLQQPVELPSQHSLPTAPSAAVAVSAAARPGLSPGCSGPDAAPSAAALPCMRHQTHAADTSACISSSTISTPTKSNAAGLYRLDMSG